MAFRTPIGWETESVLLTLAASDFDSKQIAHLELRMTRDNHQS